MSSFSYRMFEIARWDSGLFRRYPSLMFGLLLALLLPAGYAFVALSGLGGKGTVGSAPPVGIALADAPVTDRGQTVRLGTELADAFDAEKRFDWQRFDDPEEARRAVREGRLQFALLLPPDFNRFAVPGMAGGEGKVVVYVAEGNSPAGAALARRVLPDLDRRIDEIVTRKRFALSLQAAAGGGKGLADLKDTVASLQRGSTELVDSVRKTHAGAGELGRGLARAGDGLRKQKDNTASVSEQAGQLAGSVRKTIESVKAVDGKRPGDDDLNGLKNATQTLAAGTAASVKTLESLRGNADRLRDTASKLKALSTELPAPAGRMTPGADRLETGLTQMTTSLEQARDSGGKSAETAKTLAQNVVVLTEALGRMGTGVKATAGALPADGKLDAMMAGLRQVTADAAALDEQSGKLREAAGQLDTGLGALGDAAVRLRAGIDLLGNALPGSKAAAPGRDDRAGASPLSPTLEVVAPLPTPRAGYLPAFVPLAAWIGALMPALLLSFRRLPAPGREAHWLAKTFGKLIVPGWMVIGQSLLLFAVLWLGLDLGIDRPLALAGAVLVTGFVYLALVFALVRVFGEFGKVVAVLLPLLQLTSGAAFGAVEAGGLHAWLQHWLPFSWAMDAWRSALFGEFEGDWPLRWGILIAIGLVALLIASLLGRWKVVNHHEYLPGIPTD